MAMLAYLLARLKEPSTYAGLPLILAAAGVHFSNPDLMPAIVQVVVAVSGLAAILIPEGNTRPAAK